MQRYWNWGGTHQWKGKRIGLVTLSIVIVNWNGIGLLYKCLNTLKGLRLSHEVIVVDNASTDGSAEILSREFPKVHLIVNPTNIGFARACNQGIKVGTGNYFLLLNPDTIITAGSIETCITVLEKHPEIGLLGCELLNPDATYQESTGLFPGLRKSILTIFGFHRILPLLTPVIGEDKLFYVNGMIIGAFMLMPRRVLQIVGGLDERIFMYGEDTDLCYRVRQAGFMVGYLRAVSIVHIGNGCASTAFSTLERAKRVASSTFYFERKHYGTYVAAFGVLTRLLGYFLRVMVFIPLLLIPTVRERLRLYLTLLKGECQAISLIFRTSASDGRNASVGGEQG